jgi:hypothetical protein
VGACDFIAAEPQRLLSAIHHFLGVSTGVRYFGRHLYDRINPAPSGEFPQSMEGLFRNLLEQESLEDRELLKEIRASGEVSLRY